MRLIIIYFLSPFVDIETTELFLRFFIFIICVYLDQVVLIFLVLFKFLFNIWIGF